MTRRLKPWAKGAFELIVHSEGHLRDGDDFDRRIALIGFDNAIEVAITTYLGLHPIQREKRQYKRDDVDRWLANYHAKLEFLEQEAQARDFKLTVPCDEVVYYHRIRNDQYHTGGSSIPESECLEALRTAALQTFGFLFGVDDVDGRIEEWLERTAIPHQEITDQNKTVDWLLDDASEPVVIAGQPYSASEALRYVDGDAYRAVVAAISESRNALMELANRYPGYLRPEIEHVGFVHYEGNVFLKTVDSDGQVVLTDTEFICDDRFEAPYFSNARNPDENGDLLVSDFSAYSMIHCFEIFTEEVSMRIARDYERSHA